MVDVRPTSPRLCSLPCLNKPLPTLCFPPSRRATSRHSRAASHPLPKRGCPCRAGRRCNSGRHDVARRIEGWFAGAADFEVLETGCEPVGSRYRLNWRFRLSRDGVSHEVIEQVAFVDLGPEGITGIDLLCSGFLRDEQPAQPKVFDAAAMGCADGLAQEFRSRLGDIGIGESLTVIVSDPAAKEDLPSLVRMMGQSVTSCELAPGNRLAITVEKRHE
jgi:TusA-related sulfurtransferase